MKTIAEVVKDVENVLHSKKDTKNFVEEMGRNGPLKRQNRQNRFESCTPRKFVQGITIPMKENNTRREHENSRQKHKLDDCVRKFDLSGHLSKHRLS